MSFEDLLNFESWQRTNHLGALGNYSPDAGLASNDSIPSAIGFSWVNCVLDVVLVASLIALSIKLKRRLPAASDFR